MSRMSWQKCGSYIVSLGFYRAGGWKNDLENVE